MPSAIRCDADGPGEFIGFEVGTSDGNASWLWAFGRPFAKDCETGGVRDAGGAGMLLAPLMVPPAPGAMPERTELIRPPEIEPVPGCLA